MSGLLPPSSWKPADPGPQPAKSSAQRAKSAAQPAESFAGGDLVPLSQRITTLTVIRVVICLSLLAAAALNGSLHRPIDAVLPLGYLLLTGLASALILLIQHRATAVGALGVVLCLDGVALQTAQHRAGPGLPVDLGIAIFLVSVCLLASFRTGLKLVIWQSLLIGLDDQAVHSGLIDPSPGGQPDAVSRLILLWALVLVVCVAAAISERELRRRRHDAETVQAFATALHRDDEPALVIRRSLRFVIDEFDADRALICTRRAGRLSLLASHGLKDDAGLTLAGSGRLDTEALAGSGLLPLADRPGEPAMLLALDPSRDPWLAGLLPNVRRLLVLPLGADAKGDPLWLVVEHGQSGLRVERRVLATAGQVSATAALALSRALLFQQTQLAAATDALTRLANRRTFDERFTALAEQRPARGFAVIIADVDRFKAVNDTHGHQVGDVVLQVVAQTLAVAAPPGSVVARYGGEEFAVLLPEADLDAAMQVGEQLRAAVAAIDDPIRVTASFGVAAGFGAAGTSHLALLVAADAALYRAKEAGRNAVRAAQAPLPV